MASEGASVSKLSKLERQLDSDYDEDLSATDRKLAQDKYEGISDKELHSKIERLQSVKSARAADGGSIIRKECQLVRVELKRRQAVSKNWRHQVR